MSAPGGTGLFRGPFGGHVSDETTFDTFPVGVNLARRTSVSAESMTTTTTTQVTDSEDHVAVFPKAESQKERILGALHLNPLFHKLEPEISQSVAQAMREVKVGAGEIVIKQGDDGDFCYVTESGSLDVFVQPPGTPADVALAAPREQLGTKVLSYGAGSAFGELALMYLQPRAASVVATSDCVLWALDRVQFRSILARADIQRRIMFGTFLRQVPLLQHLREDERARVSDAISIVDYRAGEVVVREDDTGSQFFMVVFGVAEVVKADDPSNPVGLLQRGDYFGELALMNHSRRAATVTASARSPNGVMRVAVLNEDAFTRLLGPLSDIMNRHAQAHYGPGTTTAAAGAATAATTTPASTSASASAPTSTSTSASGSASASGSTLAPSADASGPLPSSPRSTRPSLPDL